jgi:hypothetical protein
MQQFCLALFLSQSPDDCFPAFRHFKHHFSVRWLDLLGQILALPNKLSEQNGGLR